MSSFSYTYIHTYVCVWYVCVCGIRVCGMCVCVVCVVCVFIYVSVWYVCVCVWYTCVSYVCAMCVCLCVLCVCVCVCCVCVVSVPVYVPTDRTISRHLWETVGSGVSDRQEWSRERGPVTVHRRSRPRQKEGVPRPLKEWSERGRGPG